MGLSESQRSVLLVQQLDPDTVAYNLGLCYQLPTSVDPTALRSVLRQLGEWHPCLRSRIVGQEHALFTVQGPDLDEHLAVEPQQDLDAAIERAQASFRVPFDPRARCFRTHLFPVAPTASILLLVVHHAVADGSSLALIDRDLETLLSAFRAGSSERLLPRDSRSYAEFVDWQTALCQSEQGTADLEAWSERLRDCPAPLDLPLAAPRAPVRRFVGAGVERELPRALSLELRRWARSRKLSRYRVLFAAFFALLHRVTGRREFVIGTFVRGRPDASFDETCGHFVNSLPVRLSVNPSDRFVDLAERLDAEIKFAIEHQWVPYLRIAERARTDGSLGKNPLFNVMFGAQRETASVLPTQPVDVTFAGLDARRLPVGYNEGTMDLLLICSLVGERIFTSFKYDRCLYPSSAAIESMARWFETLVVSALDDPERTIGTLQILSGQESLAAVSRGTQTSAHHGRSVIARFEEMAVAHPDAIVVSDRTGSLTYARLADLSDRLSTHLRSKGVAPGDLVGVYLERSTDFFIAVLAIQKLRAAYLPLSPSDPELRTVAVLEDAGCRVLVARHAPAPSVANSVEHVAETADAGWRACVPLTHRDPIEQDDLAYVIYTSGSTGRPKGVEIRHDSLANLMDVMRREMGLAPGSRLLSVAPFTFDLSIPDIFLPLTSGGRTDIASAEERTSGEALARALEPQGITHMAATPSTWQLIIASGWQGSPELCVMCGGEAMSLELARALSIRAPVVWNLYGPTEATVWTTMWRVGSEPVGVELGAPIDNLYVLILDAALQPVPAGVAGELCIGGAGVARGYLNRPELTQARFVRDPLESGSEELIYRTGDLARRRLDGSFEFLGRMDHQVKVRGYRIELGEVEAALEAEETVAQAIAMAREDRPGDVRLVAYARPNDAREKIDGEALRQALARSLPAYMIPSQIVTLAGFPLNRNGKVDRSALPAPADTDRKIGARPRTTVEETIARIWSDVLGCSEVGRDENFFDMGGHSLLVPQVIGRINDALDQKLSSLTMFRVPTVRGLAQQITGGDDEPRTEAPAHASTAEVGESEPIAIIGWSGKFPGAPSVDDLWTALRGGRVLTSSFTLDELLEAGMPRSVVAHPDFVPVKGVVDDGDGFDAAFFGYSPREAESIDPQHRAFLECAWSALEAAGHPPGRMKERVGVFGGAGSHYFSYVPRFSPAVDDPAERYLAIVGNTHDFLTARVSYKLDLTGPSVNVQTACSTSLVAVHLACAALRRGEADVALAGGVCITMPIKGGYIYQQGGTMSPDGRCRPFDAKAEGMLLSNGVAIVVLKPLSRAVDDGDIIHAVIRGSAVTNDGHDKIGFTAPSVAGQCRAIQEALRTAGVEPAQVGYVEAHGTGTRLGDPIEAAAWVEALGADRSTPRYLGATKANVGHLDAAAGVTGLIKAALVVRDGVIPPVPGFEALNPEVDLAGARLVVPTEALPWPAGAGPRIAGVTSLGLGGANAHVVVSEPPPRPAGQPSSRPELLLLSAATAGALESARGRLATYLRNNPAAHLSDVAFTLREGRAPMKHRCAVVARSTEEAAARLAAPTARIAAEASPKPIVFLLPGVGSQYVGMGEHLYRSEPSFRDTIDHCADAFVAEGLDDIRDFVAPRSEARERLDSLLVCPSRHMPAIFAIEVALGRLLIAWGLRPDAMFGLSLGEISAACISGALSTADAIRLVALRGKLTARYASGGGMLVVRKPAGEVGALLTPPLAIAVETTPDTCVVSGPSDLLDALTEQMQRDAVRCLRLEVGAALHSPLLRPAADALDGLASGFVHQAPSIPYYSGVTGAVITQEDLSQQDFWSRHLIERVRADEALQAMGEDWPQAILLEVGPGHSMVATARIHPSTRRLPTAIKTMPSSEQEEDPRDVMLVALGALWCHRPSSDQERPLLLRGGRRIALPTYPFDHACRSAHARPDGRGGGGSAVGDRKGHFIWEEHWEAIGQAGQASTTTSEVWWLFGCAWPAEERLLDHARGLDFKCIRVTPGDAFRQSGKESFTLNPSRADDYHALWEAATFIAGVPSRIIHLWGFYGQPGTRGAVQNTGLSISLLAQAFSDRIRGAVIPVVVGVRGAACVTGTERLLPGAASAVGASQTITIESPKLSVRCVDFDASIRLDDMYSHLVSEVMSTTDEALVAVRGGGRWRQRYRQAEPGPVNALAEVSKPVFLFSGGLGGVGLSLGRQLAEKYGARFIFLGRTELPPRAQWQRRISTGDRRDAVSQRLRGVLAIEKAGGAVLLCSGDITSAADVSAALSRGKEVFGGVHGILHAAGVLGSEALTRVSPETYLRVVSTKLDGLINLHELLRTFDVRWKLVCSSIVGILGAPGSIAYSSANSAVHCLAGALGWRAIAWGPLTVGMGADPGLVGRLAGRPICEESLLDAFEAATALGTEPLVVDYNGDLASRRAVARTLDWAALTRAGDSVPKSTFDPVSAPTTITGLRLDDIARIWQATLGGERPMPGDDFFEAGGSSLLAIQFMSTLRRSFGLSSSVADLLENPTLEQFYDHCRRRLAGDNELHEVQRAGAVRFRQGDPGVPPLVLLPPATGSLMYYPDLVQALPPGLPIWGLRQPGADGTEPLTVNRAKLLDRFHARLLEVNPEGPYRLVGHSMGGIFCYLLAQRLVGEGRRVELVALLDSPGPGEMDLDLTTEERIRAYMFETSPATLESVDAGVAKAKEAGPGVADEFRLFETYAANISMMRGFSVTPFDGRGLYLRSRERDRVNSLRPESQWIDLFEGGLEVHVVPGNHVTLLTPPNVHTVADVIARALGLRR